MSSGKEAGPEEFQPVARVADVPPGRARLFESEGRAVLLANDGGRLFAFEPLCPHQGKPLDGADVWRGVLECPWHHFRYCVETGENIYPRNVYPQSRGELARQVRALRASPLEVREEWIWVRLRAEPE